MDRLVGEFVSGNNAWLSSNQPSPSSNDAHRAIEALIRDWQFLESLGMGPIQLVGEDEEEEEEAALAKAISERDAAAGQQGADG